MDGTKNSLYRRTSLSAEQPFEGNQKPNDHHIHTLVQCKGSTRCKNNRGGKHCPQLDRANLTPPCPNGCKAAISDAVSIGLFPGSESNVFSSFSLPPFPTIRKYSSILSSSQSPNHQRTPPKLTPRTHRYLIRYLRSAAR